MSMLGALAGGYVNEARNERARQDQLDERQREMQMGLGSMILQNPAVPPEYKGPVMEHLVSVVNTPRGKKLPSWDKMMSSLPATSIPAKTSSVQQPQLALQPPAIPPGAPQGSVDATAPIPGGPPSGPSPSVMTRPNPGMSISPSGPGNAMGIQPPAIPPGAVPPTVIPGATGTVTLAPQQTGQAGQFHFMNSEEMAQREGLANAALIKSQVDALRSQGFSDEQIAMKLGMSKLVPIPLGGLYNTARQDVISPTNVPMTKVQYTVDGQGPFFGFASRAGGPILDSNHNPVPNAKPFSPSMMGSQTTSEHFYTDAEGNVHAVPTTKTTRKMQPGPNGVTPPATPPGTQSPANGGGQGSGRIVSGDSPAPDAATKMVQTDAIKASQSARTMVNLLDTQKDYMDSIASGKAQPTPRQDLSLIVAAVRAMNPGTVRLPNKELELELKAGSYGDRFRRAWDNATNGTLPDDQRQDLFSVVNNETTKVAKDAAANWTQAFGTRKPVPPHLKRFTEQQSAQPQTGGGGAHIIELNGKHYQYKGTGDTADLKNYDEVKVQ